MIISISFDNLKVSNQLSRVFPGQWLFLESLDTKNKVFRAYFMNQDAVCPENLQVAYP